MRLMAILLFFSLSFAQSAPPISEVLGNNTLLAHSLEGHYNSSNAVNGTALIHFGPNVRALDVSGSLDVAGLSLMLDGMTYPADGLALLLARGHQEEHLTARPAEGYPDFLCDRYFFEHMSDESSWRCDFEPDFCAEFENRTYVVYELNATFSFRNASATVPADSTSIPVPTDILEAMKDSSGADTLNVKVDGNITFVYEINDRGFGTGDCTSNYVNYPAPLSFSTNRSFQVAGTHRLFFLRSPVLGEQWYRNNRFNLLVLSQAPLYSASAYLNGGLLHEFDIRNFTVLTDGYGIQQIVSNKSDKTNESGWSESKNLTTPTPLESENRSFAFIYEFNSSYEGLGRNNLSLSVNDSFLAHDEYNITLLSRMLSYNGTLSENGTRLDPETSRRSTSFGIGSLSYLHMTLGLVALLLFLAFLNFWIKK